MGKPYSRDLRERVVAAVEKGGIGCAFWRWDQHGDQLGAALPPDRQRLPGKMGGHKPKAIVDERRAWLLSRIKEKDFTLRGLVAELASRGLKVDYRTVWNFVHAEKLSFKKNRARERTGSPGRRAKA